jgi:hypothetical protein
LGLQEKSPRLHNLLFKPFLVQENSVMQVRAQQQTSRFAVALTSRQVFLGTRGHHPGASMHARVGHMQRICVVAGALPSSAKSVHRQLQSHE